MTLKLKFLFEKPQLGYHHSPLVQSLLDIDMASTKFVRQKPKLIKQKRNDENCDIEEKGVEFLEIDEWI